ncbi:MAG: NAD-dependent epimerase/dehydratase family protein [Acidobacteria bacterium]|nr:NAD-dependent epimerase/dehydratase family protein [Acidobacteriota bacterium]MBI3263543.1 NAD-dependent epimerase/dehydratase family protein [Acidobacteriota bacterium]
MKVLVTGGTGYLGSAIVKALASRGHEPVVFARHAIDSGLPGVRVNGDVRDAGAVLAAATGCAAVCHSAALVSVWRPRAQDFDDVNVGGLRNVLETVRRLGISRFVYTSTFLALPPNGSNSPGAWNDYQRTKVLADRLARSAADRGAPIVVVYPGVLYGPGVRTDGNLVGRMLSDHMKGRLPGLVGADRLWSFSWIEDVAAGHVAALERGRAGARYRLCGVNAPQIKIFELLREQIGRPLPRRIPRAAATMAATVEELAAALFGRSPQLTSGTVEILIRDWAFDSDDAMRELDYRITPMGDGLARCLAELR